MDETHPCESCGRAVADRHRLCHICRGANIRRPRAGSFVKKDAGFTWWVVLCPHCTTRRLEFWPGTTLPDLLTCDGCGRVSAGAAWLTSFMRYFTPEERGEWVRLQVEWLQEKNALPEL